MCLFALYSWSNYIYNFIMAWYSPLVRACSLLYFRLFYSSFFVSSSGTFPVVVVVTAAAVLVLTFTFYFSIYTFRPLQLHCFIAFFATFFNTKFIWIAVSSQYIICGIIYIFPFLDAVFESKLCIMLWFLCRMWRKIFGPTSTKVTYFLKNCYRTTYEGL